VQRALARRGYYHGAIDGVIGPGSRSAIRSFQASHGMVVTGEINAPLVRALGL
jgi:peptidoglycan hydrolase-like protein with peptidoglycan-binding domain